jgi:tRNA A37 threonylcarbamoyladenosine modification protein TsaB
MILLIINTAGEKLYVSLYKENKMIGRKSWPVEVKAGLKLIATIEDLLADSHVAVEDIDRIAVHSGPGLRSSFLRVGVVAASIMSLANGAELVSITGEDEEDLVQEAGNKPAVTAIKIMYRDLGWGKANVEGGKKV